MKQLKKKDSNNIKDISIQEKYEKKLKDFSKVEDVVAKLYEKKVVKVEKKKLQLQVTQITQVLEQEHYLCQEIYQVLKLIWDFH